MSRESAVFFIGIILFLVPFLGITQSGKDVVTVVAGIVLMVLGVVLRRASFLRSIENVRGEKEGEMFTESKAPEGDKQASI